MKPKRIRKMSRWYVANVVFRPKDENGVPIAKNTILGPEKKTAMVDRKRFWDTYVGIEECLANPAIFQ